MESASSGLLAGVNAVRAVCGAPELPSAGGYHGRGAGRVYKPGACFGKAGGFSAYGGKLRHSASSGNNRAGQEKTVCRLGGPGVEQPDVLSGNGVRGIIRVLGRKGKRTMRIIVDAYGGDNAPLEIIKGAALAVEEYGFDILLTGKEKEIRALAEQHGISLNHIDIADASDVIGMNDEPKSVLKEHKDCSMAEGLRRLAAGEGDAFVSAGSTGALIMGATFLVKRIKGVSRAALAPLMPSTDGPFMLIDSGRQCGLPSGDAAAVCPYGQPVHVPGAGRRKEGVGGPAQCGHRGT